jgi:hypothetical protein
MDRSISFEIVPPISGLVSESRFKGLIPTVKL